MDLDVSVNMVDTNVVIAAYISTVEFPYASHLSCNPLPTYPAANVYINTYMPSSIAFICPGLYKY